MELSTMRTTQAFKQGPIDLINKNFPDRQDLTALQIGSYSGQSAQLFLSTGKIKRLYCIDPWQNGYDDTDAASKICSFAQKAFDDRFRDQPRISKIKGYSQDKIKDFSDSFFDFIYIDGNHQQFAVQQDIKLCLPKVKQTGVIAGHDYDIKQFRGVVTAVNCTLNRCPQFTFSDFSWSCHKALLSQKNKRCMFSIISEGYEKPYKVLLESFLKYNKEWDIVLFYPGHIQIQGVTKQIDITQALELYPSSYDIRAKIWSFRAEATRCCLEQYEQAVYCDSDICFYNQLPEFESTAFTLHNNHFVPEEWLNIRCQDGFINTGFYVAKNDKDSVNWFSFVQHIQKEGKVYNAILGGPRHQVWDQKIYFFLPFITPAVYHICYHDGINVARWNLCQRKLSIKNDIIFSNMQPLICFHFSNWNKLKKLSLNDPVLYKLVSEYERRTH